MKQAYAKDVFLSFFLQIFENGRSFLLIPVIAKTLGASGYGIWVQVKIGIAFLCPFLLLGIGGGISRFLPGSSKNETRDGVFSSILVSLTTGTGLACLILLLEGAIRKYIGFLPNSGLFIKGLALFCIAEPLNSLYVEYFRAFRKMKTLLVFSVFDTIFEFTPVFWFAYNGFGIGMVIFSFICGRLIMAGVKSLFIFREIGIGNFQMPTIVNYIKFGFPLIWANIFFFISNYIDRYLLGFFHSAKEVGIYSLAYSIGYTVVLMSAPWDKVLIPTITKHWNKGDMTEVSNYFNHTLRYVLILSIPMIVYLTAMGKEIVKILSTSEFNSAIYIIPVMLVTFIIFEVGIFYQRIVMLARDSNIIMKVFGISAIISLVLNVILIPRFSIVGAAVSLLFTYSALFTIFYKLAKKSNNDVAFNWLLFFQCSLATIPGCIIFSLNKKLLFFNIPAAIFLYFAILWMLDVIGKREINFLKRLRYGYNKEN